MAMESGLIGRKEDAQVLMPGRITVQIQSMSNITAI